MFKFLVGLCACIFLVLQFAPDTGQERDGLRGAYAPLIAEAPPVLVVEAEAPPAPETVAAVAPEPAPEPPPVVARVEPPVADPAASGSADPTVLSDAFLVPGAEEPASQGGLTLALPLVEAEAAEPAASPVQGAPGQPVVKYVVGSSVNVRSGPSAETESLGKLARGESVLVIATDSPGWSMIRIEGDGLEGYIASRFLGDTPGGSGDALFGSN